MTSSTHDNSQGTAVGSDFKYDYIIVGAGSAGAVVAARLSEDPQITVLLIEAGPVNKSYWSKIPLGFPKVMTDSRYAWSLSSEPEPALKNRRIMIVQGKMVGGSSALNGMVYVRGFPSDYADWSRLGADGWSYEEVLPFFKKAERYRNGGNAYHGERGPLGVEGAGWRTPLADAFISAGNAIGLRRLDDFAGAHIEGIGYHDLTTWHGRRSSTWQEYLAPISQRKNLHIVTDSLVEKVTFSGRRTTGVIYQKDSRRIRAQVRGEVILSAGALRTPQLLQLSGIGPGGLLQRHGIPLVHELRGVGENLMDHVQVGRLYKTSSQFTINALMSSPIEMIKAGVNYYIKKEGPLTVGAAVAGAFASTQTGMATPNVQIAFTPFLPNPNGLAKLADESGFLLSTYQLRPESRGHVRIQSQDPRQSAAVTLNALSTENDRSTLLAGLKLIRRIADAAPLRALGVTEVTAALAGKSDNDSDLLEHAANIGASAFHYSGTARMGRDEMAVVDPLLRVHGIDGLRVVDASVMPTVTSGNTNAATIMIGEKGAQLIKSYR